MFLSKSYLTLPYAFGLLSTWSTTYSLVEYGRGGTDDKFMSEIHDPSLVCYVCLLCKELSKFSLAFRLKQPVTDKNLLLTKTCY